MEGKSNYYPDPGCSPYLGKNLLDSPMISEYY